MSRRLGEGTIDWTALVLRVNGVGRPTILSPTGGLTPRDPYEMAREDAQARLGRVLARLPLDGELRLGDIEALAAARRRALSAFTIAAPLYFSDGTVHLPARLSFEWAPAAAASALGLPSDASAEPLMTVAPSPPPSDAAVSVSPPPTGLLVRVDGAASPALRLLLRERGGRRRLRAGLPGDPVGAQGVRYFASEVDARGSPLAGDIPLVLDARPATPARPGVLLIESAAADRFFGAVEASTGLPGGVAVVVVK